MKIKNLIAHIPARAGSKRVRSKNLRLLNGKPMIAYAIECAKACSSIEEIYVNSDSEDIGKLAESMGVKFYKRDSHLASDTASGDDFTIDIMEKLQLDTLLMISPVCPLVNPAIVNAAIEAFQQDDLADTLITCNETSMQTALEKKFINIDPRGPLAPTQDNPRVQICNWAVTIWNVEMFRKNYQSYKGGYCGTNRILFPIDPLYAVKVSYEEDFQLADTILRALDSDTSQSQKPRYWNENIS